MRIQSIELVNFRSHERTKLVLKPRTKILGANNAGKSTVIDALRWGLSGELRGLDGNNRDILEIVREGAVAALTQGSGPGDPKPVGLGVKLEIENFGRIVRQTNGREVFLKVKDWTGSNKEQQAALFEKLHTTKGVIAACLDTPTFLELHHSDAKNLIMGVLDVRIPAEELEPFDIAGPLSLEERERHYKRVFDERTDAKRDLDQHVLYPAPEGFDGEEPPPVEDLQHDLEALRATEREMIASTAEARGKREALLERQAALSTERDDLQGRIARYGDPDSALDEIEERLALMEGDDAGAAVEEPASAEPPAAAEAADDVATGRTTEIGTLRVKLADERGRLNMIAAAVDGIDRHDPAKGCVLDSSIPCQTPAKEFRGKLAAIRKEIKALEKSVSENDRRLSFLQAEDSAAKSADEQRARERRAEAEERLRAERDALRQLEQLRKRKTEVQASISHLQQDKERQANILAELAEIATEIANLGEISEPVGLEALQERIRRGEQLVAQVRAWHADQARHLASAQGRTALQAKVDRLELLCAKLGPKGLIVDALEKARGTFEQKVNAALSKWGYALSFTIDPWTVRVRVEGGPAIGRKFTQLSKSERLRVGLCLQLAIAEISGLWFVAIDEVDMLDEDNREVLSDVVEGWPGQIVFGVTEPARYEVPDGLPDDVAIYKLELKDGLTRVAEPALAHA
jgi:exonuclease SbcC